MKLKESISYWENVVQDHAFKSQADSDNWRNNPSLYESINNSYWKEAGFTQEAFVGKTILDIGAGSKARGAFYNNVKYIAIEPLAKRFAEFISWCDIFEICDVVYSEPAEFLIEALLNSVDFIFSVNVLDHCYDFSIIVENCTRYLKSDGVMYFAFDLSHKSDSMHPLVLTKEDCEHAFSIHGLTVESFSYMKPFHPYIANVAGSWHLSKT